MTLEYLQKEIYDFENEIEWYKIDAKKPIQGITRCELIIENINSFYSKNEKINGYNKIEFLSDIIPLIRDKLLYSKNLMMEVKEFEEYKNYEGFNRWINELAFFSMVFNNFVNQLYSMELDNKSRNIIYELKKINLVDETINLSKKNTKNNDGDFCYIATMAYGNYDHPQVLELRTFRDEFLSKSYWGRNFIKLYYKYSPLLVEKLKDKTKTNDIIRTLLDHFIKIIKK